MTTDVTFSVHSCVHGYHFGWWMWMPQIVREPRRWFYSVHWHDGVRNQEIISADFKTREKAREAGIKRVEQVRKAVK